MAGNLREAFKVLEASPSRRGLIGLIDRQRAFKGVLEHHEEREEIALLPELDKPCLVPTGSNCSI